MPWSKVSNLISLEFINKPSGYSVILHELVVVFQGFVQGSVNFRQWVTQPLPIVGVGGFPRNEPASQQL